MTDILIASTSLDAPSFGPVARELSRHGYGVLVYEADKVASASHQLAISVDRKGSMRLTYRGMPCDLSQIRGAWYRHPDLLGYANRAKATELSLQGEVQSLQDALWSHVPESAWLNAPSRIKTAQVKVAQLALAAKLGFEVPETVVSNNWTDVESLLRERPLIAKMSKGVLYDSAGARLFYTTILTTEAIAELRSRRINPFPAIFQLYIEKSREWRITVVGDQVFAASIYTANHAKDDWRRHQMSPSVEFKRESIADDVAEKCIRFLDHGGLRYGAFDLIEDRDGRIVFLELNPNGQFRFLEDRLGLPISRAIAAELARTASKNEHPGLDLA